MFQQLIESFLIANELISPRQFPPGIGGRDRSEARLVDARVRADRKAEAAEINSFGKVFVTQFDHERVAPADGGRILEAEDGLVGFAKAAPDVPDLVQRLVDGPGDVRVRGLVIEAGPGLLEWQGSQTVGAVLRRRIDAERGELEIAGRMPAGSFRRKAGVGQRPQSDRRDPVEIADRGNRVDVTADVVARRQDRSIALDADVPRPWISSQSV